MWPSLILATGTVLSLEAFPMQQRVIVGEPVRVTVAWKAAKAVDVAIHPPEDAVVVMISNGAGTRRYQEISLSSVMELAYSPVRLVPGREVYTDHFLVFGRHEGLEPAFAFPRPGRYTLRFLYGDATGISSESNEVHITVDEPSAPDAELLHKVGQRGMLLAYGGKEADEWLDQYPKSPLLRLARLERYRSQESRLLNGRDPETNERARETMGTEAWTTYSRRQLQTLLSDLRSSEGWGPLEDIRLLHVMDYARRLGDTDTLLQTANELTSRFPRSAAAQEARILIGTMLGAD